MSRILPLKSYSWKVSNNVQVSCNEGTENEVVTVDENVSESEVIQKPQLDFYIQIE